MNNKMTNGLVQLNAIKEDIKNNVNIPTVMRPYASFEEKSLGLLFILSCYHRNVVFRFILENDENGNTRTDRLGIQVVEISNFPTPTFTGSVISFDECITNLNLWLIENEMKCVPLM